MTLWRVLLVVLTEDDYMHLTEANQVLADYAETDVEEEISGPQWVKDHPAEAAQALIDAGHLEEDGVYATPPGWEPDRDDPEDWDRSGVFYEDDFSRPDEAQPLYRLVLPTEETTVTEACGRPLHKACNCVRPRGHEGPCNCAHPDASPVVGKEEEETDG